MLKVSLFPTYKEKQSVQVDMNTGGIQPDWHTAVVLNASPPRTLIEKILGTKPVNVRVIGEGSAFKGENYRVGRARLRPIVAQREVE